MKESEKQLAHKLSKLRKFIEKKQVVVKPNVLGRKPASASEIRKVITNVSNQGK